MWQSVKTGCSSFRVFRVLVLLLGHLGYLSSLKIFAEFYGQMYNLTVAVGEKIFMFR
jgi:hypothetical protein